MGSGFVLHNVSNLVNAKAMNFRSAARHAGGRRLCHHRGAPTAKMLDTGVHATLEDIARAKRVHATYVSRVLKLTAP